jgi:glycogen operon protein
MRSGRRQLLWVLVAAGVLCVSCDQPTTYARLYASQPKAPSIAASDIEALNTAGATIVDLGVNFSVYANHATRVDLLLFEDPEAQLPTQEYQMTRFGNVWNTYVEGVGEHTYYGYIAWGPNWTVDPQWIPGTIFGFKADVDAQGNRYNPNKLLVDPYARAIHRDHNWTEGSAASGPDRAVSTFQAGAKSIVTASHYSWSDNETLWRQQRQGADFPGHNWNDLIIYETHPKGFTKDPASGVLHPGVYRGIAENASYFADLGVTAVELMPAQGKVADGGYWGYMTLNFFAPELTYSDAVHPWDVPDDFRAMVDALHQQGIEVLMDVVYNHFGEGGLWENTIIYGGTNGGNGENISTFSADQVASLFNFRGLDNADYYALTPDNQNYWDNTGVGQESRPNNTPMRRLILDSLRYWVDEMHVDGFRFDLAPVLGEKDGDYNNWDVVANTVLQNIIDDPDLNQYHTRIIAEPWEAGGNDPYRVGQFPAASDPHAYPGVGWYEWNGQFRDFWRPFENCPYVVENGGQWCPNGWPLNSSSGSIDGGGALTGSAALYKWNRRPYHAVNFVTIHDGFTMYDLFSYQTQVNGCGPLNQICCDNPNSPLCEPNSGTTDNRSWNWGSDEAGEDMKRQLMRNLFTAMIVSQGTPMILGGDEWMRTQLGNNNAYSNSADNPFNWYQWGEWLPDQNRNRMHDFVRKLLAFRKAHAYAFAPSDWTGSAPFAWKNTQNSDALPSDWAGRTMMMHYYDSSFGRQLAVLINGGDASVNFTLPSGVKWGRIIDTQSYFDTADYVDASKAGPLASSNITPDQPTIVSGTYGVASRSMVVLEQQ